MHATGIASVPPEARAGGRRSSARRCVDPGAALQPTKCVRCWQHRPDVGAVAEHPEICGRCVGNLSIAGRDAAVRLMRRSDRMARPPSWRMRACSGLIYLWLTAAVVVLDQLTKAVIEHSAGAVSVDLRAAGAGDHALSQHRRGLQLPRPMHPAGSAGYSRRWRRRQRGAGAVAAAHRSARDGALACAWR